MANQSDDADSHGIRLIARGDDAALAESANDAIRECFDEGILRNVSVMAPCPALDHAVDQLAGVDGLCTGVHVTLTAEWDQPNWGPVLPPEEVPSLVDEDGNLPKLAEDFVERDPDPDEVVAEMEAQIDRLREVGFEPSYLDTHMAIEHHLDWFVGAMTDLCKRKGLIDGTSVPLPPGADGPGTSPQWLLDRLEDTDGGTYLVVGHPMYEDDDAAEIVGLGNERGEMAANRADQRRMFTDARIQQYVEDHDIEVLWYNEL